MTLAYIVRPGLTTQKTSIKLHKIDSLILETYGITLTKVSFQDSFEKIAYFEETFL